MAWRTAPSRPNGVSNGAALSTGPVVVCHSNQKGRTLKWPDRQRRYTFALVRIGRIGRRMTIGKRSSRRSVSYLSCPRQALHPEVDHLPSETGAVSALTAREEYEAGSESRIGPRRSRHSLAFWPCYRVAEDIRCSSHSRRRTFMGVIESIICALLPVLSTRRMNRSEVSTACASLTPAACTNRLRACTKVTCCPSASELRCRGDRPWRSRSVVPLHAVFTLTWIRLFICPPRLSERDTPHNLKGISLDGGRVREFLE